MQITNLLTLIGLGGVAIGLLLNVWAVHRGNVQKRAEFLMHLYDKMLSDDIMEIFFKLEYGKIKKIKENSADEKNLNKLLSLFDNIGHLKETTKNFTDDDLEYFAMEIISTFKNRVVKEYLESIEKDYTKQYKNFKHLDLIKPFGDFKKLACDLIRKYEGL